MPTPDPIALPESGAKPYKCDYCGQFYGARACCGMRFDYLRHHGENILPPASALTPAPQVRGDAVLRFLQVMEEVMDNHPEVADWVDVQLWNAISTTKHTSTSTPPLNEPFGKPEELALNEPSGDSGQLASLEQRAHDLFWAMMQAPYADTTIGNIVCAETTPQRLESAWIPLISAALSTQARVVEAVAYLDVGAGGYLDLGSDLSNEQLSALPKGRHMLGVIGTYGVDGYTPQPREVRGVEGKLRGLLDRIRPGVEVAPWVYAEIFAMFDDTTPQDAAGVQRIEPLDVTDAEISEWLERHDLAHAIRGRDARAAFEDAQSFHMTKPLTTPPPGVDVGKLRELRELVVDLRKDASGGEGYNYTAYEEGRIAEKRYCAHRLAAIIDAAAPGVQAND